MKLIYLFSFFIGVITIANAQPAGQVDTLIFFSSTLQKNTKVVVVTPAGYTTALQYPVLYLLHGYSGNYSNWIVKVPQLKNYATQFNMLVVCPNGENSWYLNTPDGSMLYQDYISKELVAYIDAHYATLPRRTKRGIAGLSMGGHGALTLAIKNKAVFGAAGSMSGAVDLAALKHKYNLPNLAGDTITHPFDWKNYSALHLADSNSTHLLAIQIDCGVEDIFIEDNRALHKKLLDQKVPHYYTERNGGHNWYYWATALPFQMLFFEQFFNSNK